MSDKMSLGERVDRTINAVHSALGAMFFIAALGGALVSIVMLLAGYQGDYLGQAFLACIIGFVCMIWHETT